MSRWLKDYSFDLPTGSIAQKPARWRDHSRLMVIRRDAGKAEDSTFRQLPLHLGSGDLIVLNDSAVLPARLLGRKGGTGGRVELLLLRNTGGGKWRALMKGKAAVGQALEFGVAGVDTRVLAVGEEGEVTVRFEPPEGAEILMSRVGLPPLPPYIKRNGRRDTARSDARRYQTIYAAAEGSCAAPTAGLHFTPRVFRHLEQRGIRRAFVTLHVGPGTFRPLRVEDLSKARLEGEEVEVPPETVAAVARTRAEGGRVIAVGTTVTRCLEAMTDSRGVLRGGPARVDLLIRPGYRFRTVDGLLTNFHLPRSSLLLLVCAFAGRRTVLQSYERAVGKGYSFYSYGDAMLIV